MISNLIIIKMVLFSVLLKFDLVFINKTSYLKCAKHHLC